MTMLSIGLGRIVPNLISRKHTNSAATVVALGLMIVLCCHKSSSLCIWRSEKANQKKEIEQKRSWKGGEGKSTFRRFLSRFLTPIFFESFILTFLSEWGDHSQFATITLATHKNAVGVAVGAHIGQTIFTSIAVVGGSMLASKISQGTVAMVGGLLFLSFSLSSYFYPPM
ncbi:hypothetical protein MKX03_017058 [Papaver bracteatum]|nr:hypothetical protein MKX03_017058 [Papaver bracteatum]